MTQLLIPFDPQEVHNCFCGGDLEKHFNPPRCRCGSELIQGKIPFARYCNICNISWRKEDMYYSRWHNMMGFWKGDDWDG